MTLLAIVGGIILLGLGVLIRRRRGLSVDFNQLVRLVLISFGLSAFGGSTVVPGLWLAVSYGARGGRLDEHLIADAGSLLVGLVVGILLGLLWAIKGYLDSLRPPEG
jgi:hypothetical protein